MSRLLVQTDSIQHMVRWVFAGTVLIALNFTLVKIGPWTEGLTDTTQFAFLTSVYSAAGVVLLFVLVWLWRSTSGPWITTWIILAGLLMRLLVFSEPPRFETDFYRYMWDGAITANGYNPYTIRPRDVLENRAERLPQDPMFVVLAETGRSTLENVNHSHLTTIYPPVAQVAFAVAYWIKPFSTESLRAVFLVSELLMVLLLVAVLRSLQLPLHRLALYWWNPITVKEFYVSAHMDGLVAMFAVAALTAVLCRRRYTGLVLLGLAIGTKLWPVVLAPVLVRYGVRTWRQTLVGAILLSAVAGIVVWPMLASWGIDSVSGVNAYAKYWINNAGFFSVLNWMVQTIHEYGGLWWSDPHQFARRVTMGLVLLWMIFLSCRRLLDSASVAWWSTIAVSGLFVLSPTQFPWYYTWVLPFLVLVPIPALVLYTALLPLYHLHYDYYWVLWIEHLPVWLIIGWSAWRLSSAGMTGPRPTTPYNDYTPPADVRIAVVIPALNEEHAIGSVLADIPRWVNQVIVADNGSTDRTAAVAKQHGATVVYEPQRGYGAACLTGVAALDRPDIVVFLDGDFSDHPQEMGRLIAPIVRDEVDLVIGSRVLGHSETGALTLQQRFGNSLACWLIRLLYGVQHTDLGPFRAIRYASLRLLAMDDRDYGWTVQMQVRAARLGFRVAEVPVSYRRRIGKSKISGTIRGVIGAGIKILSTIFREGLRRQSVTGTDRLIIFGRYPTAGKAKTRLIPLLGPTGAALLHRQLVRITVETARRLRTRRSITTELRFTGASQRDMAMLFGRDLIYREQGPGDLGQRLRVAVAETISSGVGKVILVGTDCPMLDAERLDQAFSALDDHDVVIGPALDGGYYLIGVKSDHPELFSDIAWGGSEVLAQTLDACCRLGLRHILLPTLSDVDTPDDLILWASARMPSTNTRPRISVIIPTRNEQDHLAATIASVLTVGGVEIIVVDGQSSDRTVEIARQFGVNVIESEPSRGTQLNLGARHARSDRLVFLHADTILPFGFSSTIEQTLARPGIAAGAFDLGIDARGLAPRVIEWGVFIRARIFGRPYGDQALFMSSDTYRKCGGFPDLPYMEDYAMLSLLRECGRVYVVPARVSTSARRWKSRGWLRTTLRHQWLILRYHLSRPPTRGGIPAVRKVQEPTTSPAIVCTDNQLIETGHGESTSRQGGGCKSAKC